MRHLITSYAIKWGICFTCVYEYRYTKLYKQVNVKVIHTMRARFSFKVYSSHRCCFCCCCFYSCCYCCYFSIITNCFVENLNFKRSGRSALSLNLTQYSRKVKKRFWMKSTTVQGRSVGILDAWRKAFWMKSQPQASFSKSRRKKILNSDNLILPEKPRSSSHLKSLPRIFANVI